MGKGMSTGVGDEGADEAEGVSTGDGDEGADEAEGGEES